MIGRKVGKLVVTAYDEATRSCTCTCTCGSGKIFVFAKDVLLRSKNPHCGCEDKILLDEATLERMYCNRKLSIQEIAEETGHNRNTISKYLKLYGFHKRVPRKEDLMQLYVREHMSAREISAFLGFTEKVVYTWLGRYGLRSLRKTGTVESDGRRGPKTRVLLDRVSGELHPIQYLDKGMIRCMCSCGKTVDVPRNKLYKQRIRDCGCGISYELERTWVIEILDRYAVEYIRNYRTLRSRHPHDFALFSEGRVRFFINVVERPHGCRCQAEVPVLHVPRTTKDYVESMVVSVVEYVKPGSTNAKREA